MKYIYAAIFTFFLLSPVSPAQISLPPVETEFYILPVILSLCDDYTKSEQFLCLYGDLDFLTINWNARYFDDSEKDIGVTCYLNCKNPGIDIDADCAGFQKCEFLGLVGSRSCVIQNPNYDFDLPPTETNNIVCKFYDPETLDEDGEPLPFLPYPERTFRPIDFTLSLSSLTVTVGDSFNFPLSVIPVGLIPSSYGFKVSELTTPNALIIETTTGVTEELAYGEPGRFSPRMVFLFSNEGGTNVRILANATSDPVSCIQDADCSYLGDGVCSNNKCWKKLDVNLKSGNASLPDFDIFGFFQIMILSSIVLVATNFKRR